MLVTAEITAAMNAWLVSERRTPATVHHQEIRASSGRLGYDSARAALKVEMCLKRDLNRTNLANIKLCRLSSQSNVSVALQTELKF